MRLAELGLVLAQLGGEEGNLGGRGWGGGGTEAAVRWELGVGLSVLRSAVRQSAVVVGVGGRGWGRLGGSEGWKGREWRNFRGQDFELGTETVQVALELESKDEWKSVMYTSEHFVAGGVELLGE